MNWNHLTRSSRLAQLAAKKAEAPMAPAAHEHDIRCQNCHQWFDVMKAEVGRPTLPNTLTDLLDLNGAWAKCPHCGFVTEREEQTP